MPLQHAPFKLRMVGKSPDHPRFTIRDNRRLVDHFWTGQGWSRRLQDARLFADPELASKTALALTLRHLRRHEPRRLFLLTVVVRVHAPEDVSSHDVETYLKDALRVGVDHKRYGTGPTTDSLVEVAVPVISLEKGR
jgi:hypothetical protein